MSLLGASGYLPRRMEPKWHVRAAAFWFVSTFIAVQPAALPAQINATDDYRAKAQSFSYFPSFVDLNNANDAHLKLSATILSLARRVVNKTAEARTSATTSSARIEAGSEIKKWKTC